MNTRRQIIISAIAAVAVTALFFFFVLKPKLTEISDAALETQAAVDQESSLKTQLARLQDLQKQQPKTDAKLARLKTYLPTVPDLPGFIRQVQAAATAAGVDLSSIAPTPPADVDTAKGVQSITATLSVSASFHRMEDFISRLERLQRVVELRTISLAPVDDPVSGGISLEGTLGLTMFVVADDATFTGASRVTPTPASTTGQEP